jgi:group I intron endonuclease
MNEDSRKWCIYAHVLKTDGRCYIGQTCNLEGRWKPSAYKNSTKFYAAIQKYGWNNFEHKILKDNLTLSEANFWESYFIKNLDTIGKGFNLNSGGDNKLHSQETKEKMSQTRRGVSHSKEHSLAISRALKGKKKTAQAIRNNQLAQHRKVVQCIETGVIYESLAEAERQTHIFAETISRCCRGKQKTASGYHWRFVDESR